MPVFDIPKGKSLPVFFKKTVFDVSSLASNSSLETAPAINKKGHL